MDQDVEGEQGGIARTPGPRGTGPTARSAAGTTPPRGVHSARTAEDTDWARIAALYEALERVLPTPAVRLNRAVAVGKAHGPRAGLHLVDAVADDPALRDHHLLPGVRMPALCPHTGRGRLSCERAEHLFRTTTGFTLRQLR